MLGFSKSFVICLFVAVLFGWKLGWKVGISIIMIYAVIKIIWNFLR